MRFGVASIRVTGMDLPSSVNTRLMPALRPTMPNECFFAVMVGASGQLDLHVDASREFELHQRVHGLVVRVDDVEHALVRAGFVLVARVLVGVRRRKNGEAFELGRQRDRAAHLRAGPLGRLDDLAGRAVDQTMIVCLQPNPDLLVRHDGNSSGKSGGSASGCAGPGFFGTMQRWSVLQKQSGPGFPARPDGIVNARAAPPYVLRRPSERAKRYRATYPCRAKTKYVLSFISLVPRPALFRSWLRGRAF